MKKWIIVICACGLVILFGVFYMQKPPKNQRDVLRIALPTDPSTLHFSHSSRGCLINAAHVVTLLFEGLMRRDGNDVPQPAIAYKVDVSRNQKKYTFHLKDCNWSDGTKVTAYDFEYAWKQAINPKAKSITPSPYYYYPIKNAKRCLLGECDLDSVGISVIDDQTLEVELEYCAPYFLDIVSTPLFFPAPKHVAEKDPKWATKSKLVCNGPFELKKYLFNNQITLSKNSNYWDKKHVYFNEIEIYIISNSNTIINMFKKGELDWIGSPFYRISYDISSNILDQIREDSFTYWISINNNKKLFKNKKLRQALSYAIDRESIVKNVFDFTAHPSMSVLPKVQNLTNSIYLKKDIELAKTLFQEALEELNITRKEFPVIELGMINDSELASRICQAFQSQWREVLGIDNLIIKSLETNVYFNEINKGNYDLGFMGWVSLVLDPIFILNSFKNKSDIMNKSNWENPEFQTILDKSNYALGSLERIRLLIDAEKILIDEVPTIPICSIKKRFAKNPKLKGEILSLLQSVDFKSAYFEEEKKN